MGINDCVPLCFSLKDRSCLRSSVLDQLFLRLMTTENMTILRVVVGNLVAHHEHEEINGLECYPTLSNTVAMMSCFIHGYQQINAVQATVLREA